jgi:hypothetical protein
LDAFLTREKRIPFRKGKSVDSAQPKSSNQPVSMSHTIP